MNDLELYRKRDIEWSEKFIHYKKEFKKLLEDFIIRIEKHSVFTPYEEPQMKFHPSKLVWEKEFKQWAKEKLNDLLRGKDDGN